MTLRSTRTDERTAPYKDMRDANQYSLKEGLHEPSMPCRKTDNTLVFVTIAFFVIFIVLSVIFYPPTVLSYVINNVMWFCLGILVKNLFSRPM